MKAVIGRDLVWKHIFKPTLFISLIIILILAACGGGGSQSPQGEKQTIGPEGGSFEFSNGIVLEIPPGAVSKQTEIWIHPADCDLAQPALDAPAFRTSQLACLGGFSGEPDGLVFAVPITAKIPVDPLESGQIPVQVVIDPEDEGLWLAQTDLVYDDAAGIIELRNITHFSTNWTMVQYQQVEDNCRGCGTYTATVETDLLTSEIQQVQQSALCQVYAGDLWSGQQGGCCLLLRAERAACAPNCSCCMQELMEVESSGVDVSFGECGFVSSDVRVQYPNCADTTPQISTEGATTPECPEDMGLVIEAQPSRLFLELGERVDLKEFFTVELTGTTPGGETAFGPTQLVPIWSSARPDIASVSPDDYLCGVNAGETTLKASLSRDPAMPSDEVTVVVNPRDVDGTWTLRPISQEEYCRFNGGEWFDEEPFGSFKIHLAKTGGDDIAAAIVGTDSIMLGNWNPSTGDFSLKTDPDSECSYLFDLYGEDICGDAIGCQFAGCINQTEIEGEFSPSNTSLEADVSWYYSISFTFSPQGTTTWECQGSARMTGSVPTDSCLP